jgi:hypothetical protein
MARAKAQRRSTNDVRTCRSCKITSLLRSDCQLSTWFYSFNGARDFSHASRRLDDDPRKTQFTTAEIPPIKRHNRRIARRTSQLQHMIVTFVWQVRSPGKAGGLFRDGKARA